MSLKCPLHEPSFSHVFAYATVSRGLLARQDSTYMSKLTQIPSFTVLILPDLDLAVAVIAKLPAPRHPRRPLIHESSERLSIFPGVAVFSDDGVLANSCVWLAFCAVVSLKMDVHVPVEGRGTAWDDGQGCCHENSDLDLHFLGW